MIIGKKSKSNGIVISSHSRRNTLEIAAGIDVGSTETRVAIADKEDIALFVTQEDACTNFADTMKTALSRLHETYIIPSSSAILENDYREIMPASNSLEDNYDSVITMVSNTSDNPMISKVRVLRGHKTDDVRGVTLRYFDSSTDKMDNQLFYVNIIDSLGYALLQKYNGCGIPHSVNVSLKISVRPKELNQACTTKMRENLVGKYVFTWKDIEIEININNLGYTTEPEAQIVGVDVINNLTAELGLDGEISATAFERLNDSQTRMHIEGGGSSIGIEVVRNDKLIGACSATFQLGGNYLVQIVTDRINEELNIKPSISAVSKAILTGLLPDGRARRDVSQLIAQCKCELARNIVEEIRHKVIDTQQDFVLRDIECITLGGRLFASDSVGASIGNYFAKFVSQLSPETCVVILPNNYIPQGNMLTAIEDFCSDEE